MRDRTLTLVLVAMFLLFVVGHGLTGFVEYNNEQAQHGKVAVAMADYFATGHPGRPSSLDLIQRRYLPVVPWTKV